jgi:hypothetical protein
VSEAHPAVLADSCADVTLMGAQRLDLEENIDSLVERKVEMRKVLSSPAA